MIAVPLYLEAIMNYNSSNKCQTEEHSISKTVGRFNIPRSKVLRLYSEYLIDAITAPRGQHSA